jgi:hypothetical protein
VLLATFAVFAVGTTRDYLTWNRLRWEALQNLIDIDHVSVRDIDGGFEFNGLYHFKPLGSSPADPWGIPDAYVIAFGPVPGYVIVKEYTYLHWIPLHVQKIVVLKKN